jgi:two-component system nitrogen regulation sensor histidine kinase NtrY
MVSEEFSETVELRAQRPKRLPLSGSGRRLSFERRFRIWLYLLGLPTLLLCWSLLRQLHVGASVQGMALCALALAWAFAVSLLMEQMIRPLQTLANVVAALREDDYSFRARGACRNDAMGDLALEVNALATMLQGQRAGTLEAIALVERVISAMQSPVLAFDPAGRLQLLNPAGERAFGLQAQTARGGFAEKLNLTYLLDREDGELLSLGTTQQAARWMVKRTSFRLRGIPHTLFVLADVSAALREEERVAWERLIRVLGHEINNSLTPIKSIAGSLRGRLAPWHSALEGSEDFERGLEVIENRADSLNRFLQAYRQLLRLPAPRIEPVVLSAVMERVVRLETRLAVTLTSRVDRMVMMDPDQIQQALINLVCNAAEAALSPDARNGDNPAVDVACEMTAREAIITIRDNGPGLTNEANLFVPFYTTKLGGTGIGLVLAQQIAEAHGGSVRLANREDGQLGCRAELRLPIS